MIGLNKRGLLFIVTIFLFACNTNKVLDNSGAIIIGKLTKKPFVNKIGKESVDYFDYYFKTKGKNYLVSISQSSVSIGELESYVGKDISVEGKMTYGAEAVSQDIDEPVQSRITDYIIIFKIK